MKSKMYQLFEEKRSVHVLYSYDGIKQYIDHVVDFIQQGILAGDYVILIENERIYPMIQSELIKLLDKDHFIFQVVVIILLQSQIILII